MSGWKNDKTGCALGWKSDKPDYVLDLVNVIYYIVDEYKKN